MGEEGNLAQARYGLAAAHVTRGEEAVAAARVDHEAGADGPRLAALSDTEGRAVSVELDPFHLGGLEQAHPAFLGRVLEQDLVELRPLHFVAVGRPRLALAEVEAVFEIGFLVVEGGPELDEKSVTLHTLPNAQAIEHRHHGGEQ